MKVLSVDQGSQEWLSLRKNKISGTDAAILTGSNKWKSKLDLWLQKMDLKEPDECTPRMQRGSDLEEPARLLLNKATGIEFRPVVVISDVHPYMMSSLDGLSPCKRFMCEIKAPSLKSHEAAIEGIIAEYYIDQIQECLFVTDCEKCYYCSYFPGHEREIVIIEVSPDHIKQCNIVFLSYKFYMQMCNMNPPEEWKFKVRND